MGAEYLLCESVIVFSQEKKKGMYARSIDIKKL